MMKKLRDNLLMLLGLPTPDENQAWRDKAAEMAAKHDALKRLLDERYETEWRITKDGKRRYRKVATKVLMNSWVTVSEPIDTSLHDLQARFDRAVERHRGA